MISKEEPKSDNTIKKDGTTVVNDQIQKSTDGININNFIEHIEIEKFKNKYKLENNGKFNKIEVILLRQPPGSNLSDEFRIIGYTHSCNKISHIPVESEYEKKMIRNIIKLKNNTTEINGNQSYLNT